MLMIMVQQIGISNGIPIPKAKVTYIIFIIAEYLIGKETSGPA
jgi:hypothetical protein